MKISSWGLRNPVPVNLIMLIVIVLGIGAGLTLRREMFPGFEIDVVEVWVNMETGSTPDQVDRNVNQVIQPNIQSINGVKRVYSFATEDAGRLIVNLSRGYDANRVKNEIKDEVDRISTLPAEATDPLVRRIQVDNQAAQIAIFGHGSTERQLREAADLVKSDLRKLGIASRTEVFLPRDYEVMISLPLQLLESKGLTIRDVAQQIRRYNTDTRAGQVRASDADILLKGEARKTRIEDLRHIPIHFPSGEFLTLGELAGPLGLSDSFDERPIVVEYNGRSAAVVNVLRSDTEDIIVVADAVREYVNSAQLPDGLQMELFGDSSEFVRGRLDLIVRNGCAGLVLVLVVLSLFLEWRIAFWAATGIAFAMIGSLAILAASGHTINMMTLFGFLMTTGIIVDDAVVIGEGFHHQLQRGKSAGQAALAALKELSWPVIAMMSTTVVAFVPLLFVPGILGKFLTVLPVVTISALLLSMAECLFILPVHLAHHAGPKPTRLMRGFHLVLYPFIFISEKLQPRLDALLNWITRRLFLPLVHACIHHRYSTSILFLALLLFLLSWIPAGVVKTGLFPSTDSEVHMVVLEMQRGTPIARTEAVARAISRAARDAGAQIAQRDGFDPVRSVLLNAGGEGPHRARLILQLHGAEHGRTVSGREFVDTWRSRVEQVPDAVSMRWSEPTGGPEERAIEVWLSASSDEELEAADKDLRAFLGTIDGVVDITSSHQPGAPILSVKLKETSAAIPFSETELIAHISDAYRGVNVDTFYRGDNEVKMWVRAAPEERRDLANLRSLRLPNGLSVEQLADLTVNYEPAELRRINGRKIVSVAADVDKSRGSNAMEIRAKLEREFLSSLSTQHPGVTWESAGEALEGAEAVSGMLKGYIPALMIIYLILATIFKSYLQPLVIMAAIPFGFIGAITGHWLLGLEFNLLSGFGIIALTGIAVNDSLVLLDCINLYADKRRSLVHTVLIATKRRFRPILLTSLTTTAGMAPVLFERSFQAQFLIPMVTSIVFGILFSTILILLLVPVGYAILNDLLSYFDRDSRSIAT